MIKVQSRSIQAVGVFLTGLYLSLSANASVSSLLAGLDDLQGQYVSQGGNPLALEQLKCFLRDYGDQRFQLKSSGGASDRCGSRATNRMRNDRAVAIIDYVKTSDRPRFFIFDLKRMKLRALHVSHGRYGDTPRWNQQVKDNPKANSVLQAKYFSNLPSSNASATGFYLTGTEYLGKYGRSLTLHGLQRDINDNACARATVIHRNSYITKNSTGRMSSGCPMVGNAYIDYVLDTLAEGTVVYVFGPRENRLPADSCNTGLRLSK